jgi:DNA (cytosine-5)-methyltransferase 1
MRFIDLFCGLGGFHLGLKNFGECVFACDLDESAQHAYRINHGIIPHGDIYEIDKFPPHDLLCGGFPCQPFSDAGHRQGEADPRSRLWLEIIRVLKQCRPKAFILENVPKLLKYPVFEKLRTAVACLGYSFNWSIIDASTVVPQTRKRLYMVGTLGLPYQFPVLPNLFPNLQDVLEKDVEGHTLKASTWKYLKGRTNWKARLLTGSHCGTLLASGVEHCYVPQRRKNPRRLTVRERARIQGLPDSFSFDGLTVRQAEKLIGNSVVPAVIEEIAKAMPWEVLKGRPTRPDTSIEGIHQPSPTNCTDVGRKKIPFTPKTEGDAGDKAA